MTDKSTQSNNKTVKNSADDTPITDDKSPPSDKQSKATENNSSVSAKKKIQKDIKETKTPKNNRSFIAVIAVIVALVAVAFAAYDFWLLKLQAPIVAQLETVQKVQIDLLTKFNQQEQTLQQTKSDLAEEIRIRKAAQAELQALDTAMQNISATLGRSTVAWRLAEVEYLLTIANHRLILAQDPETAIAILETADERIKAIGDTSLLKVRKVIADELLALRAMPVVDVSGLALRVGSLINSVEALPLRDKKRIAVAMNEKADDAPLEWRQIPMAVWKDLKSLVQVRRHQQPTEPLLPPDQTQHLYQNLTLKLEQARLAVLRRDTALFHQYLSEAESWVTGYFEPESPAVSNTVASLKEMLTIELRPAVADVSGSLRLLREVLKQQPGVVTNSKQASPK